MSKTDETTTNASVQANRAELGGKAAVLLQLAEAGFPVPPFEVDPDNLTECLSRLGSPVAVRSSASAEDGGERSFAGQFESFLNLSTADEVEDAVANCRQSLRSVRVADYCRQVAIDVDDLRMHVIVQRMVQPELSGVAFSVDPLSGEPKVVIEACRGTGEQLLSGTQNALSQEDPLLSRYRSQIDELAQRVQRHFGVPQDIEFAIEGGAIFLLQARPITRIQFGDSIGEWTNADFRDGGVSSSVCSPLMWSLYDMVWERSLKWSLDAIHLKGANFQAGRMFFGRPYWNVGAVKERVKRIPGFVERDFDEDLGLEVTYEGRGFQQKFSLAGLLNAIPVVWKVNRFIKRQLDHAEESVRAGLEPIDQRGEWAKADPEANFEGFIREFYLPFEMNYFQTIFALSLAKLDFHLSHPDVDFSHLVSGLPPLSHMAPAKWFSEHPDDESDWIEHYRHHSRHGIDVIHPRWDEEPQFVASVRRTVADSCQSEQLEECEQLPELSRKGRAKLDRLRRLIWLREELRNLSNRVYYYIRRCALRIADERFLGNDIFFMSCEQILSDDRSRIEEARWTYDAFRNFRAPNEIGVRFTGTFDSESHDAADSLIGIAAGRGRAIAKAHVAHDVDSAMEMEPGRVLVCPFTEPGWTPALGKAAAVVTETGGLLSHAAVICREYGLPAVLAVNDATRLIPHGAEVEVDGMTGAVRLVQASSGGA